MRTFLIVLREQDLFLNSFIKSHATLHSLSQKKKIGKTKAKKKKPFAENKKSTEKSHSISLFFLVTCSVVFMAFSHEGGGDHGGDPLSCIQKLLPCQPYLKSQTTPPPSCCVPMKQVVAQESQCLCAVFNNPEILKSLNVTQQDGINLAKSCGASADVSICKKGAPTPAGSSKAPPAPSTSSNGSAMSPPPKSAGSSVISHVAGSLSMAAVFSLFSILIEI